MMEQITFFEDNVMTQEILDIRTEKQRSNKISYDVGEKIGGAKKDLEHNRERFMSKPTLSLLQLIEEQDKGTAAEVVQRDTFFSWFSLLDCKERGMSPAVAKALQLFIRRIPKTSADTVEARSQYVKQMLFLAELLKTVTSPETYRMMERRIMHLISLQNYSVTQLEASIASRREMLSYEDNPELIAYHTREIEEKQANVFCSEMAKDLCLTSLQGSFLSYFYKGKSRQSLLQSASAVSSWDELLPSNGKEKDLTGAVRKPVWERELPETPTREGGQAVHIENPEDFVLHFGFRASEFGHYLSDSKGKSHLLQSAQGYTDLATILGLSTKTVSLDGKLAMAFGSRGGGKALGHYEPARQVINLTKNRGSLGVLAHEWFHALDHHLYSLGHDYENGKVGYLSQTPDYALDLPVEVIDAMNTLLQTMTEGSTTAYVDVSSVKATYDIRGWFERDYYRCDGDLQEFMDEIIESFDNQATNVVGWMSKERQEKEKARIERRRKTHIRRHAEALAQYHEAVTGERINMIPYTSERSAYLEAAINLDKGKVGKYWSSPVELIARAFESYIADSLRERGWRNDYLVCGIGGDIYPLDEEREAIHKAMETFLEKVKPLL